MSGNAETQDQGLTKEQFVLEVLAKDGNNLDGLIGVIGIGAAIALGAAINPFFGGLTLAAILGGKVYKQVQRGKLRYQVLQGEIPPVALLKEQDEVEQYKQIIGDDAFTGEIGQIIELKGNNGVYEAMSEETRNLVTFEKIARQPQLDVVAELADYFDRHVLILGGSGGGKDFIGSNAVRVIKKQHPEVYLYVIDPKGDHREAPYYQPIADTFVSAQCGQMTSEAAVAWFRQQYEHYRDVSSNPDQQTLLVITETTLIGESFKLAKDTYLSDVVSKQITTGSSYGNYLWFMAQSPNLADLGFSNNSRMQLNVFAVVHRKSITAVAQWQRTKVVKKASESELRMLCENSEVDRAFFCTATGNWHSMPKLTNYSLFDRDSRTRLNGTTQETPALPASTTPTVIQSEAPTTLQPQDDIDRLLTALDQASTGDIIDTLKSLDPSIPNEKLNAIVSVIKTEAVNRGKPHLISKFSL